MLPSESMLMNEQQIKLNAEQEAARMETWKREIYGKIEAEFVDREVHSFLYTTQRK